jgi:DNA-binding NtrC family response regulator
MGQQDAVTLLVIDDDPLNLGLITAALKQEGLEILTSDDPQKGFEQFLRVRPRIVLLDLVMPKVDGMELLERMVAADPTVDVILMTGQYSTESAVEAIQKGACDYLNKPLSLPKLRGRVASIVAEAEKRQKASRLDEELLNAYEFEGMVGRSPLILEVFAKIRRIAPHFRAALVTGPTGTGKELAARALHRLSPAAAGNFAVCNCAALVDTLVESELFGYVRGAFTGANQDKAGLFEYANGGTVFLDEIGELSASAQAKLLRVLQNRQVQRVGSPVQRQVDVRVVAATHRNLRAMVKDGAFREDLYYRLSMVEVQLPSLAERREDLPLLQRHFLEKFAKEFGKPVLSITRRAQSRLSTYAWPGNIRELENAIGNACMMTDGNSVDIQDLPDNLREPIAEQDIREESLLPLEEVEHRHLMRVLERVGGNKAKAAEILGISRATVYQLLAKVKLEAKV